MSKENVNQVKPEDIKRIALVLRISSALQGGELKTSIADQLAQGTAWAEREGWEVVATFDETAEKGYQSGRDPMNDRPHIMEMLSQAQAGEFDLVVFRDSSKLGRHDGEAITLGYELRDVGVFIGFSDGNLIADIYNKNDRLLFMVGAWAADVDWEQIQKNLKGGRYRKAMLGMHPSGPIHMGYGTYKDGPRKGQYYVIEEDAEVVRFAFTALAAGNSTEQVATMMRDRGFRYPAAKGGESGWQGSHIRAWMKQPALMGAGFQKHISPGPKEPKKPVLVAAPALFSKELWEEAHRANKSHLKDFYSTKRTPMDKRKPYALSAKGKKGLSLVHHIHADGTEVPLWGQTVEGRRRYKCAESIVNREKKTKNHTCPGFSVGLIKPNSAVPVKQTTLGAAQLESRLLLTLIDAYQTPETLAKLVGEADKRAVHAESLGVTVEQAERKLVEIEKDRDQVGILFRVQGKDEDWLVAEMGKLDAEVAKANGILARASEERQAATVITEAHDAITAVFTADRDADGMVKVNLPNGRTGQFFAPDLDTNEGLRQMAEAVLAGKEKDLPVKVRQTIAWLMTALNAKVFIEGTTEGTEPEISLRLWTFSGTGTGAGTVSSSNPLHRTSMTVLPT